MPTLPFLRYTIRMSILHTLQWRYATKQFDSNKKVSEDDITELLTATNLSASAYGLQPYKLYIIHNDALQKELREYSYHQSQITDASHIFVFAAKTDISPEYISEYITRTEQVRNMQPGSLETYKQSILGAFAGKSQSDILAWSQKQAYLALGTLLIAGADLKIDICPMEGFIPDDYNRILGLHEKGLHATVVAAVGYRSHQDSLATAHKSRKPLEDLVHRTY